jgi:uncharacterized membrane protein
MNNAFTYALLSGVLFGLWPSIARTAGSTSTNTSLIVSAVTFLLLTGYMLFKNQTGDLIGADSAAIWKLALAGLVNGAGILAYGILVNWQGDGIEISKLVPLSVGIMIISSFISGVLMFNEPITATKIVGVLLLGGGIFFMSK